MLEVEMVASIRQNFGKGAMRSLRRAGRTPAVLYGPKMEPLSLSLETKAFSRALVRIHGQNAVVNLNIEGDQTTIKRHVLLKEVQADPVQDTVIHADFFEISLDEPRTLTVPIHFVGTPKGVDMGGILHVSMDKVPIRGLPLHIPDYIEADITALELGGPGMTCKDLVIPANVTLLVRGDAACASVVSASKGGEAAGPGPEAEGEEAPAEMG